MYFSLDFGGTNYRISWSNSLKSVDPSNFKVHRLFNSGNYDIDTREILEFMKSISEKSEGISIALPGQFDYQKFELKYANYLKPWEGKHFFKDLKNHFGTLPLINKDSIVAGVGEGIVNNLREKFLYLTWGTGIGGCIVIPNINSIPETTILDWEDTFKKIEELCGGANTFNNTGKKMENLNTKEWELIIQNFVSETEKISAKIGINKIVMGGGITDKKPEVVLQIINFLKRKDVFLIRSRLGDNSAVYGGYILLSQIK